MCYRLLSFTLDNWKRHENKWSNTRNSACFKTKKKTEVYGVFDSHVAFLIPRKGEHLIYILETIEIGRILKFTVKIQKRVIFWKVLTQTSFWDTLADWSARHGHRNRHRTEYRRNFAEKTLFWNISNWIIFALGDGVVLGLRVFYFLRRAMKNEFATKSTRLQYVAVIILWFVCIFTTVMSVMKFIRISDCKRNYAT